MDSTTISGRYYANLIARNLSMDMLDFNRYNPGLDETLALGKDYPLRLPKEKLLLFQKNKYAILQDCVQQLFESAKMEAPEDKKKGN